MPQHWTALWRRGWLSPARTPLKLRAYAHELASPPCYAHEALSCDVQGLKLPVVLQATGAVVGLHQSVHAPLESHAVSSPQFDRSHD